jgi:hypothetical protein
MRIGVFYASDTQAGIIEGFKDLGHTVFPLYYGLKQLSLHERVLNKLCKKSNENLSLLFNAKILEADLFQKEINSDAVLFIKGQHLDDKSKFILSKWPVIRKVQWTIDSLCRFPGQATLLPFMDRVFFQDGFDIKKHSQGRWLPLGFDNKIFTFCKEKTIDLLMLGNLNKNFYKRRREFFREASKLGSYGLNVCFAGYNADNELIKIFKNNKINILGKLPLSEYAETIAKSKVCINITQDDGGMAVNPLFFAIPSTGSCQVTDNADYLREWLNPGFDYFPADIMTLNGTIKGLLNRTNCIINKERAEKISEIHSYKGCAKTILETL